jgi:hypothetical protein
LLHKPKVLAKIKNLCVDAALTRASWLTPRLHVGAILKRHTINRAPSMRRLISSIVLIAGLLAAATFGIALIDVLMPGTPLPSEGSAVPSAGTSRGVFYTGLGLVSGLLLAWGSRIDWSSYPQRLSAWFVIQQRRAAWLALGCISTSILLFY